MTKRRKSSLLASDIRSFSETYTRARTRGTSAMLEGVRITAGSVSMLIGAALVYDAIWSPGLSQTAFLLGGAVLVSLGLISMWYVARNWMEFRRYLKNHHQ
jgi:hypothetical protein